VLRRLPTGATFRVVSDVGPRCAGPGIEHVAWSPEVETASLDAFDVGIMPLSDDPFSRGKCAFKLLQYGAAGLPAVASPVGMNRDVIEHAVTGFLADTPEDWGEHLTHLAEDEPLRERLGRAARKAVAEEYDVRVVAQRLARYLNEAVAEKGGQA